MYKTGDLVWVLEQNQNGKYIRSKNYSSPCIFIDRSFPDKYALTATNQNLWFKVFYIASGDYEWFDEPYWRLQKM